MERDAAEAWLAKNDPDYSKQKRGWQTPSTDALARDRSRHQSLKELKEVRPGTHDGNYIKRAKPASQVQTHKMENETAVESKQDKDE